MVSKIENIESHLMFSHHTNTYMNKMDWMLRVSSYLYIYEDCCNTFIIISHQYITQESLLSFVIIHFSRFFTSLWQTSGMIFSLCFAFLVTEVQIKLWPLSSHLSPVLNMNMKLLSVKILCNNWCPSSYICYTFHPDPWTILR